MASAYKTRGTANGLSGSAFEKLDEDFDNFLDCMKPYVLNLSRKAGNFVLLDLSLSF